MKQYLFNKATLKIELHFEKEEYLALGEEQKRKLKSSYLWSSKGGCWVSRAKEPNLYWARKTAEELGFEKGADIGERLTYAEQVERQKERAESRAERFDQYAENADKRADHLQSEFNECRKDWSWLTQPNINTSGGRAFTNQRNKVVARYEKGFEEMNKADYFRERSQFALEVANMEKYNDPTYLRNRIRECKRDIKHLQKKFDIVTEKIARAEQGEQFTIRGETDTIESMKERKDYYVERIDTLVDKKSFMEMKLGALGGGK